LAGCTLAAFVSLTSCTRHVASERDVLAGYQPAISCDTKRAAIDRLGDNKFRVRLVNFNKAIERQPNPVWCWAACAATASVRSGLYRIDPSNPNSRDPLKSDDLIRIFAEHTANQSASGDLAVRALAPELHQQFNKAATSADDRAERSGSNRDYAWFWSVPAPNLPAFEALISDLAAGDLVSVGIQPESGSLGHVVLAFEATFSKAATDHGTAPYFVYQVLALDPLNGQTLTIEGPQLERVTFASGRRTAQIYVAQRINGLKQAKWQRIQNLGSVPVR